MNRWDIYINGKPLGKTYSTQRDARATLAVALMALGFSDTVMEFTAQNKPIDFICINGVNYEVREVRK